MIDSFACDDLEEFSRAKNLDPQFLARTRAIFVSAGASAIAALPDPQGWLQVNLRLQSDEPARSRFVTSGLHPLIEDWLRQERGRRFWYVYKPPGIRLRFCGAEEGFRRSLHQHLDELVDGGSATGWSQGVYDPEVQQFGGLQGLELAHLYFTIDSLAVLDYQRHRLAGEVRLEPPQFSLVLLDRLVREVTDDPWEQWDLWCNMRLTHRLEKPVSDVVDDSDNVESRRIRALLLSDDLSALSDSERTTLATYERRLRLLGTHVRRCTERGQLLWGTRQIVPFWIIFHWNRMQFPLEQQCRLASMMVGALCPKLES